MKKNIAIILLSVCLAVTLLVSVALCLYLPYKQTRWRELLWEDYLIWCELIGCEIDFGKEPEGVPNAYATIRCLYSESFDLSIPRIPSPKRSPTAPREPISTISSSTPTARALCSTSNGEISTPRSRKGIGPPAAFSLPSRSRLSPPRRWRAC